MLSKPAANRHEVPIHGTEDRRLPKWLEPHRDRLTRFVRSNTEAGMVPMSDFRTMRISFAGVPLDPRQRSRWWQEAQAWQDLLLRESGNRDDRNVDCVNNRGTTRRSNNSRSRMSGWA